LPDLCLLSATLAEHPTQRYNGVKVVKIRALKCFLNFCILTFVHFDNSFHVLGPGLCPGAAAWYHDIHYALHMVMMDEFWSMLYYFAAIINACVVVAGSYCWGGRGDGGVANRQGECLGALASLVIRLGVYPITSLPLSVGLTAHCLLVQACGRHALK